MAIDSHSPVAVGTQASQLLSALANKYGLPAVVRIEAMQGGGSTKQFFRLFLPDTHQPKSVVGVIAASAAQVQQIEICAGFFHSKGLHIARLLASSPQPPCYLLEDLGQWTLFQRLVQWRNTPDKQSQLLPALSKTLRWLPQFQKHGTQGMRTQQLPVAHHMNKKLIQQDWQNFMQYFVASNHPEMLPPSPQVQADIQQLLERLLALEHRWFCYRDFQCRNIMWPADDCSGEPIFIDYQDGMQGPLAYDLVSLLYSPDSGLTPVQRTQLTQVYLEALVEADLPRPPDFETQHHLLLWQRRTQAIAAYARIAKSGKANYLKKLPPAIADLLNLLAADYFPPGLPHLKNWLQLLLQSASSKP